MKTLTIKEIIEFAKIHNAPLTSFGDFLIALARTKEFEKTVHLKHDYLRMAYIRMTPADRVW